MNKTPLRNYARLIARKGVNVQKGQEVVIFAELDQPAFAEMVAEECYRAGAETVLMEWQHQPMSKLHMRYRSLETLSRIEEWELAKLRHRVDTLPAMIYLESSDPDGMNGIDQEKLARSSQARYPILKPFRDEMENKYQWCIAAVPGAAWAKKVFPGCTKFQAVEKLWQAILYTSRADGPDPMAAWDAHNADLKARCAYLNGLQATALEYKSASGTDFRVGLIPDAQFLAGSETTLGGGVAFQPNIPSEEVFTSPKAGDAEGIVVASRPLSFRGELIEDFSITFEKGRAVDVKAAKNEALLRTMIGMDEGSALLGECALVPYDSPIRNSEILFYNTLFDENAACHLALGAGFPNCIRDYDRYTLEECRAKGINDSMIHQDFMIGTEDLSVDAVTADGKRVAVFRGGNWAF